jgi:hypothetical protein
MTPDDAKMKEFAFESPPAVKRLADIQPGQETEVIFYMRSSTTGNRGVNINVSYNLLTTKEQKAFQCRLNESLDLETVDPFAINSELLRYIKGRGVGKKSKK